MSDWLAMGGYGHYVWSAYAIVGAAFVGNLIYTRQLRRHTLTRIKRFFKKQAHHASSS